MSRQRVPEKRKKSGAKERNEAQQTGSDNEKVGANLSSHHPPTPPPHPTPYYPRLREVVVAPIKTNSDNQMKPLELSQDRTKNILPLYAIYVCVQPLVVSERLTQRTPGTPGRSVGRTRRCTPSPHHPRRSSNHRTSAAVSEIATEGDVWSGSLFTQKGRTRPKSGRVGCAAKSDPSARR